MVMNVDLANLVAEKVLGKHNLRNYLGKYTKS